MSESLVMKLYAAMDSSGKGFVEMGDFVKVMSTCCRGTLDEIHLLMFNMFDVDQNGALSREEMHALLLAVWSNEDEVGESDEVCFCCFPSSLHFITPLKLGMNFHIN